MWLVVGLGNPGSKYSMTRHNIGFMFIDYYLREIGYPPERSEKKALTYKIKLTDKDNRKEQQVLLCKPQTFMNLSGDSVRALADYYKIPPEKILVVQDDKDMDYEQLKIQWKRGHGGQNGIRDIHNKMGTNAYYRLKLGVGKTPAKWDTGDWVLSNFSPEEQNKIGDYLNQALDAFEALIFKGYQKASTEFNAK